MRLNRLQKVLWAAVAVALVGVGAAVVFIDRSLPSVEQAEFRPTFALPDADGRLRSPADFPGKHLLVFFGFTNCPDICPTTLAEVAQVMDDLGDQAGLGGLLRLGKACRQGKRGHRDGCADNGFDGHLTNSSSTTVPRPS